MTSHFDDPEVLAIDALLHGLSNVTVSTSPPTAAVSTPHLQVESDGTPSAVTAWGMGNIVEFPTIRVVVHCGSTKRGQVKSLAGQAQRVLFDAGFLPLVNRSAVISDPTTKNLMVWFTVRATLSPQDGES